MTPTTLQVGDVMFVHNCFNVSDFDKHWNIDTQMSLLIEYPLEKIYFSGAAVVLSETNQEVNLFEMNL